MNSKTIAKNSFWYGVETVVSLALTAFTSIFIARKIGPTRIDYFLYVIWILGIVGNLGMLGIPAATRKYMSEYFGRGRMGIAKTVVQRTQSNSPPDHVGRVFDVSLDWLIPVTAAGE
ncbi:MAG: hypothetical protein WA581_15555 [Candidatus Acidiferrales bacterium]